MPRWERFRHDDTPTREAAPGCLKGQTYRGVQLKVGRD